MDRHILQGPAFRDSPGLRTLTAFRDGCGLKFISLMELFILCDHTLKPLTVFFILIIRIDIHVTAPYVVHNFSNLSCAVGSVLVEAWTTKSAQIL